jgi:hypothetical protein
MSCSKPAPAHARGPHEHPSIRSHAHEHTREIWRSARTATIGASCSGYYMHYNFGRTHGPDVGHTRPDGDLTVPSPIYELVKGDLLHRHGTLRQYAATTTHN